MKKYFFTLLILLSTVFLTTACNDSQGALHLGDDDDNDDDSKFLFLRKGEYYEMPEYEMPEEEMSTEEEDGGTDIETDIEEEQETVIEEDEKELKIRELRNRSFYSSSDKKMLTTKEAEKKLEKEKKEENKLSEGEDLVEDDGPITPEKWSKLFAEFWGKQRQGNSPIELLQLQQKVEEVISEPGPNKITVPEQ